jgi:hypothetical protein
MFAVLPGAVPSVLELGAFGFPLAAKHFGWQTLTFTCMIGVSDARSHRWIQVAFGEIPALAVLLLHACNPLTSFIQD